MINKEEIEVEIRDKYQRILSEERVKFDEKIKELEAFRDRTIGLYATDRPDLFQECKHKNLLFRIECKKF